MKPWNMFIELMHNVWSATWFPTERTRKNLLKI